MTHYNTDNNQGHSTEQIESDGKGCMFATIGGLILFIGGLIYLIVAK